MILVLMMIWLNMAVKYTHLIQGNILFNALFCSEVSYYLNAPLYGPMVTYYLMVYCGLR